jgi:hypothetical protein
MRSSLLLVAGLVMFVVGGVWAGQGLGYFKGSPMTGVAFWGIVGPIVAGLGLALIISVVQHRRRPPM